MAITEDLRLPSRSVKLVPPIKHDRRPVAFGYAGWSMTLCIAARFTLGKPYLEESVPAFVLCTDGRLSEDEWGSQDSAIKTHTLGYNFLGLMAGHWSGARELFGFLEQKMRSRPLQDRASIVENFRNDAKEFCESSLCPDGTCEGIITGFTSKVPLLLKVRIEDKVATMPICQDREEVGLGIAGDGVYAAHMIMNHRGYDPLNADLAMACYCVYEAKKFSEAVTSVGPKTWLKVHLDGDGDPADQNRHCQMDITQRGISILEEWRKEFFLRPVDDTKGRLLNRFY